MLPPAPPRFSITMVCPSWRDSGSVTMRPRMSMVLPALNGTTARIGLPAGQALALGKRGSAGAARAAAVSVKKWRRLRSVTAILPENYNWRVFLLPHDGMAFFFCHDAVQSTMPESKREKCHADFDLGPYPPAHARSGGHR